MLELRLGELLSTKVKQLADAEAEFDDGRAVMEAVDPHDVAQPVAAQPPEVGDDELVPACMRASRMHARMQWAEIVSELST